MIPQKVLMYSFKGGAGRTVTMANVAYILAKELHHRVLCIDLDVESAGASVLFGLQDEVREGRIWTLQDVLRGTFEPPDTRADDWGADKQLISLGGDDFVPRIWPNLHRRVFPGPDRTGPRGGYLDFIPSRTILASAGERRVYDPSSQQLFETLLMKIDAFDPPPEFVLFDSASGQGDAAALGLTNCTVLVVFVRWSRQFVFGTSHFLRTYVCTERFAANVSRVLVVPTAVPEKRPGGEMRVQLEKRMADFDSTIYLANLDARKHLGAPEEWIRRLDDVPECAALKWDDRVFLMEGQPSMDVETQEVLRSYRMLARSIAAAAAAEQG